MLALILAPAFIAIEILVLFRTYKYLTEINLKGKKAYISFLAVLLFAGILPMMIGLLLPAGNIYKRILNQIGYYWLGFILYFFLGLAICLVVRLIYWLIKKKKVDLLKARQFTISFIIIFVIVMSLIGINNAHNLQVNNYEINVNKESKINNLNIVLLADIHLGNNVGLKEIEDMVNKVNECNPDLIIIAGDIFDNEYQAIESPDKMSELFSSMKSKYGTYACLGNHDTEEKILSGFTFSWVSKQEAVISEEMLDFLEKSNINLLYDEQIIIEDSVVIYGRPDAHKINFGNTERKSVKEISEEIDDNLLSIIIDHQPSDIEEMANYNMDIVLSGHTHGGQVWPSTILNKIVWPINGSGYVRLNNTHSFVSNGVGLFGPNMRSGALPEIMNIKVNIKGA